VSGFFYPKNGNSYTIKSIAQDESAAQALQDHPPGGEWDGQKDWNPREKYAGFLWLAFQSICSTRSLRAQTPRPLPWKL